MPAALSGSPERGYPRRSLTEGPEVGGHIEGTAIHGSSFRIPCRAPANQHTMPASVVRLAGF